MSQVANVEWKGRGGPFSLHLGPGVFSPTHTSKTLADALEVEPDDTVIDVGCGSGVLSFVAAKLGAKRVFGVDLSPPAVEAARENAALLGLQDVCEFRQGDLLEPVRDVRASVLIGDVSGIPDEIAAASGWFEDVPAGGPTGAELPTKFLRSIGDVLAPGGACICRRARSRTRRPSLRLRARSSATTCRRCSSVSSRCPTWSRDRRRSPG